MLGKITNLRQLGKFAYCTFITNNTTNNDENSHEKSSELDRTTGNLEIDQSGYGTTTEIVHFDDTVKPRETINKTHVPMPEVYLEETLKGWLSRVYPLKTIMWTPSAGIGDQLGWFEFPSSLFHLQSLFEKVKNIHYFRANVRVSIRMNGTRMHYGKLLVTSTPYPKFDLPHFRRTHNIFSATGHPFTIISPTESEPVDIMIPFISPMMYSTINPKFWTAGGYTGYDWGGVGIYVLNPLDSVGGPSHISFTVFASFEDISFSGYTATNQSIPTLPASPPFIKAAAPVLRRTRYEAQAKTVEVEEASAKGKAGIVTRTLEKVSAISGALSLIPEISPIAATVEGVSSALTPVAAYFGWCKPDNVSIQHPVGVKYADFTHSAGVDNSVKLALYPDNSVQPAMNILGNRPEMDFDYILSQPMLVAIIPWDLEPSASVLAEIPVTPSYCHQADFNMYPTFNSHIANAFRYWRGDMRYYITISCSAFHSGRLRVSWTPNDNETPVTLEQQSNVISKVIDIQTETEFGITIPFLSHYPYLSTTYFSPFRDTPAGNSYLPIGANGRLYFTVLNALTSTADPTPQIHINVFASSSNMKFGCPRKVGFDILPTPEIPEIPSVEYEAQGLTREEIASADYFPIVPAKSYEIKGYCFGEDITNVKQLTNRPTPHQTYSIGTTTAPEGERRTTTFGNSYTITGYGENGVYLKFARNTLFAPVPPGYWFYSISHVGRSTDVSFMETADIPSTVWRFAQLHDTSTEQGKTREPYTLTGYVMLDLPVHGIYFSAGSGTADFKMVMSPAPGLVGTPEFPNWPPQAPELPEWDETHFVPVKVQSAISGNYPATTVSFATYFLSMYRFWRGSLRYKLFELSSQSVGTRAVFLNENRFKTDFVRPDMHSGAMAVREPVSNVVEITVPYYYETFCKLANFKEDDTNRKIDHEVTPVFTFVNNNRIGMHSAGVITLSTGDDFEYYFLVAPPAVGPSFD